VLSGMKAAALPYAVPKVDLGSDSLEVNL